MYLTSLLLGDDDVIFANEMYCNLLPIVGKLLLEENRMMQIWVSNRAILF